MAQMSFGPYKCVDDNFSTLDDNSRISEQEVRNFLHTANYVKHKSEFLLILERHKSKIFGTIFSCISVGNAVLTICAYDACSDIRLIKYIWKKFNFLIGEKIENIDISVDDIDLILNGINIGLEANLEIEKTVKNLLSIIKNFVDKKRDFDNLKEIKNIIYNHDITISRIYDSLGDSSISNELDDYVQKISSASYI